MSGSNDREKWASIGVLKATKRADRRERMLSNDMEAYKRLRKEGLQPPRIDGCAQLEREAVTRQEIESGACRSDISAKDRKRYAAEFQAAMETGREA